MSTPNQPFRLYQGKKQSKAETNNKQNLIQTTKKEKKEKEKVEEKKKKINDQNEHSIRSTMP